MVIPKLPGVLPRIAQVTSTACLDTVFGVFVKTKQADHKQHLSMDPTLLEAIWIGHATFLLNLYGTHILTDPVFGLRALTAKRHIWPSLRIKELPRIDAVVLSHSHFDHMDFLSLQKIAQKNPSCIFYVPVGYRKYMPWAKNRVFEIAHHASLKINNVTISAYEPLHWTNRYPWQRFEKLNSYLLEAKGKSVFFAGDTAYHQHLHVRLPKNIDVALLPIGAYWPAILEEVHQTPEQALQLAEDIGAKHVVPMHYETFRLSFEEMDEPRKRLMKAKEQFGSLTVHPLQIGQKVVFDEGTVTVH